ncbi:lectin, mannose-binding 2 [Blastomyces gilchristii SLH14081]|uniref:Lectin, mannose-binding 2 n=1 Tax=Blastomyces gilchristii (strain SLH14081) TaxID=559298 RepID=A0A179US00_BLAGS|nr:lectin, mannose-binding 2 [Blastomyces gilchristii SLH14081]OAT09978.1 lectin, mannose-binding 2 [Blastomyces gilchristii SLH14081]
MLLQALPCLWLWVLGLCLGLSHASDDPHDFEDHADVKRVPMIPYSISQPYIDTESESRWFDYGGDTVIRTDQYIRLTPDRPSRQGWLFSRVPLTATNWQVEVEFSIHGEGNLHGDGMAIWLTKQRSAKGPVFGSIDKFEGLGIFFDTYKNNRPSVAFPYVMAMLGDGQTSYDQAHDGKANELAGCSARGLRGASVATKARITYFQDKFLALDLQYKSDHSWTPCFTVEATEQQSINIPTVAYLGMSAETGELSDNHDIISISTYSLYDKAPEDKQTGSRGAGRKATQKSKTGKGSAYSRSGDDGTGAGGWFWFFFKIIMFLFLILAAYIGFTAFRASQRRRF